MAELLSVREAYLSSLSHRLHEILIRESPKGMGWVREHWEALIPYDREVIKRCKLYEQGALEREKVDEAAVAYLHEFRRQVKLYREFSQTGQTLSGEGGP